MKEAKIIRDDISQAILNTDNDSLIAYRKRRDINKINSDKIIVIENKIDLILELIGNLNANSNT